MQHYRIQQEICFDVVDAISNKFVETNAPVINSLEIDKKEVGIDESVTFTLDVTGGLNILGGTVYVTAETIRPGLDVYIAKGAVLDLGGTTVEFNSIAGAGTVRNGTVKVAKLKINVDEGALIFDNAILESGRKIVDFGRTSENPLVEQKEVYDVCTFTSSLPSLTGWKVQNTGLEEVKGVFFAEGDTVKVQLMPAGGFRIILR